MAAAIDSCTGPLPALTVRGLVKDFAIGLQGVKLRAVDHLDLTIPAGEIYGLVGPNGSGKSTTIKLVLGLLKPTAGETRIFGVPSGCVEVRAEVGYLPEAPNFYRHLSGRELVRFYGRMCGLEKQKLLARVDEALARVGMSDAADRRVGTYSKGMLQRIGLAQAIVHDPRLLILDEPTAGVDPVGTAAMLELIQQLKAEGKTVIVTSHLLGQVEEICDRVAILDRGRRLLEREMRELVESPERQALVVDSLSDGELAELRGWLAQRGRTIAAIERPRARLDRIFLEHVASARRPSPAETRGKPPTSTERNDA